MSETAPHPAQHRDARAIGSVVAGVAFQATYVLVQFIVLAILIREVGEERFGMWVTIFSMTMWLNLLFLGMDRALMTTLGRIAFSQPAMARRVILSSTWIVLISAAVAGITIALFGWSLPWPDQILNVAGETATREATPTAVIAMGITIISIPLVLSGFILQAYQRGAARHLIGIVSQFIGLALLLLGAYLDWSLPWLGAAILSPWLFSGALQWLAVWQRWPGSRDQPAGQASSEPVVAHLFKTGLGLWLVNVSMILMINSGAFVVTQIAGAAGVVPYGAVYRLVGPILVCYVVIAHSYWPAFGDAARVQDHQWIVRALRRATFLVAGLWLLGAVGCLLGGEAFIVWWLGEEARPSQSLILAGLALALAAGIYHISVAALSGQGYIKVQAVISAAVLLAYGVGMWLSARHINATWVMLIQAMGIGLVGVINWVYLISILRRTNGQEAEAAGTTTRSSPH